MILGGGPRAVYRQLNTRNIIASLVAVDTLIEGSAVYLSVDDLVLVEKVFVDTLPGG